MFPITLKEIAAEAGVSISTVSRVLNNKSPNAASPAVQERIWEIARRNGYLPNRDAQALKHCHDKSGPAPLRPIYCLIACSPEEVRDDPFFNHALASVGQAAFQRGYVLAYTFYASDPNGSLPVSDFQNLTSDCLVVIGRFSKELYQKLTRKFKKIVYLGWNDLNLKCDGIICDGGAAAKEAVRYLHSLGHRSIGFIGTDQKEARYRGYLEGLHELGLSPDPKNIACRPVLSCESGMQCMTQLLEQGTDATAIYCANDTTAIGVLRACKEHGLRVPEDISIMGANDIETVQYISPMLTTIRIPLDEMGRMATHLLTDRIEGGHTLPVKVFFPFEIVCRESCGAPRQTPLHKEPHPGR